MPDQNQKPQTDRVEDRARDREQIKDLGEKSLDADDAQQVKGGAINRSYKIG